MELPQACPICGNTAFDEFFSVKDHSITQEVFLLSKCQSCQFLFTSNAPSQAEIGRYYASDAYISHTDSKKGLVENLYQLVRKRTLIQKRKLINKLNKGASGVLLDYGCGTGAFLQEMKINGWKINGIEPDAGARKKAEQLNEISIGLPENISSLPDGSFDVVTLWHVLEHVHDLDTIVVQLKRLLNAKGKLIIAVPNHQSYDANYYGSRWAAYDVPRHLYHFGPGTMKRLMDKHRLTIVAKKGMWFDAFYVSMLSEQYKSGKNNYLQAFIVGLISNAKAIFNIEKCSSLIYIITK